ncbi:DNA replication protein [Rhizobium phage RHph_Y1_10]|nr:DNA replication protein [Rhizobium phage RHph_Y1_10]
MKAETLRAMLAAGCSAEQIVAAAENEEAAKAERLATKRAQNAERQRKFRERNKSNALHGVTSVTDPSPEGSSPTPPSPNPQPLPPSPPKGGSSPADKQLTAEFESEFWPRYPNKVGKPVALKSYLKARKDATTAEILGGLDAYVRKTDDRPWCNPSTWLNQSRWTDRPAQVVRQQPHRERTILDAIDERMERPNGNLFDALRTIDVEPSRREPSAPDLRLVADASRH